MADSVLQNNDFSDAIANYGKGQPIVTSDTELNARNQLNDMNTTTENMLRFVNQKSNENFFNENMPKLSPDQLNQKFPGLQEKFTEPMTQPVAQDIADYQTKKQNLQNIIDNGPQDFPTKLKSFGHNLLAGALDPINAMAGIAVAPIVGAAATALGVAESMGIGAAAPSIGQYIARAGVEAGIANIPETASDIVNKETQQEHVDPVAEMKSFTANTMGAAVLFGAGHYGYNRFVVKPVIVPVGTPVEPSPVTGLNRPFTGPEAEVIHGVAEGQIANGQPVNVKPLIDAIQSGEDIPNAMEVAKNIASQEADPTNKTNYDPEVTKALAITKRVEPSLEQQDLEKKTTDVFNVLKQMKEEQKFKGEDLKAFENIEKAQEAGNLWTKIKGLAIDCVGANA